MRADDTPRPVTPDAPLYARFSRRFRGIFIDWVITLGIIFGALLIASGVADNNVSHMLGAGVIAVLLLYEPVLVSFTGGTFGHRLTNLRVVDNATGGNVSFLKACARLLIKGLLGWYSFVIIAATQRNQAIHDLVTRSTVQIRNPAKARPGQFVTERAEPPAARMPARWQRVLMIGLYLLLSFIAVVALDVILTQFMVGGCSAAGCISTKKALDLVLNIGLLLAVAAIITQGWRGRLYGARASQSSR